jgi:hypothetical protein
MADPLPRHAVATPQREAPASPGERALAECVLCGLTFRRHNDELAVNLFSITVVLHFIETDYDFWVIDCLDFSKTDYYLGIPDKDTIRAAIHYWLEKNG